MINVTHRHPHEVIDSIRASIVASSQLQIDTATLTIEPILNWGGFVNRSFRIADGRFAFLLKLAANDEARTGLERWRTLARTLHERYSAPRMHGWLEVEGVGGGPVFEWVDGTIPTHLTDVPLDQLLVLLTGLHADEDLVTTLDAMGDRVESCADAYMDAYHRRFVEDLDFIGANRPPFVSGTTFDWMRREADALATLVLALGPFAEPAGSPIHGDLWLNNLIITATNRCSVVDWDGMRIGDPALDWAMLFGPTRSNPRLVEGAARHARDLDRAGLARLAVYGRASLLDWTIDPLADWVQAEYEPFHGESIRSANQHIHAQALAEYQALFARG